MSPAENRRARDAVRQTTRASTARPGQIEYVRTPLLPSLKLRRTSRGVPRSPRIEGALCKPPGAKRRGVLGAGYSL